MKIVCSRKEFLEAFQVVSSVIPLRSAVPILQNIKITTEDKKVYLIGTDLEVGIKYEVIAAEIKEAGSSVLPTQRLGAILRETSEEKIKMESDTNRALISTKDAHFKIMGAEAEDYPDFPSFDLKRAIEIDPKGLKEMVSRTAFAASHEIIRYALTGLLVEIKKKELRMVGSDGKRLAYIKRKSETPVSQDIKVIVPTKGMMMLEKIIRDDKTPVKLILEETQLKISLAVPEKPDKEKSPEILLFTRLVEGSYPDYETVVPADCDKKIEMKTGSLLSALRRVSVVTTDKFKATKLSFKDNKLTFLSRTQEVGEARIEMDIKYEAKPFEIVFNPDFFIDVLRVIDEASFILELKDKTSPAVFKVGRDYIYLVMPLTVDV